MLNPWKSKCNIDNLNIFLSAKRNELYHVSDNVKRGYLYRIEDFKDGVFIYLWLASSGCTWAKSGYCSFCYYDNFAPLSENEININCKKAIHEIKSLNLKINSIFVSPSGSFYNSAELSENNRKCIYECVNELDAKMFLFETRVETISPELLKETKICIKNKQIEVSIGLESSNDYVRNILYNKGLNIKNFEKAIKMITEAHLFCSVNLLFGAPFLSKEDRIIDILNSVRYVLSYNICTPIIFPIHIRKTTGIRALYEDGLFEPVTVWDFVDMLNNFSDEELGQIIISWHKVYSKNSEINADIVDSFRTCNKCYGTVLYNLDQFRTFSNPKYIRDLNNIRCECRAIL